MLEDFTKGVNQSGKPCRRGQDFMGMCLSDDTWNTAVHLGKRNWGPGLEQ